MQNIGDHGKAEKNMVGKKEPQIKLKPEKICMF